MKVLNLPATPHVERGEIMSELSLGPSATYARGGRHSIIRSFHIEGLHGYRNIGLNSRFAATILIAKNGTGKTTLLGAMDAFLRMELGRLRELQFDKIRCEIAGVENELILTHDDVMDFLQIPSEAEFIKLASRSGIDPASLFQFLISDYLTTAKEERYLFDDKIWSTLSQSFAYNHSDLTTTLDRILELIYSRQDSIRKIRDALKTALSDTEIVYLPTYRRIELALTDDESNSYGRKRRRRFNVAVGSLYKGDIQFGLGDISDRLMNINNEITYSSHSAYGELSANIINELIDGSFEREEISPNELPSKEELEFFFSRLRGARRNVHLPSVIAPNIEKLFVDEPPQSSKKFLNYFLKQLGAVILVSKKLEEPVDAFIDSCNKYLSSKEPSTELEGHVQELIEGKKLKINRRNLKVHVESLPDGRKISLNALSSGEKQMVSLFAKLFLYPKKKIVLIDEPELSLSIDWQSQILVDVMNAPLCEQVVAITHSPFVFENELDPFAQPLSVYTPRQAPTAEMEFEWDELDNFDHE